MKSDWDNPTCNYCREHKNHLSSDCSGEVYYICSECLNNPVRLPASKTFINDDEDEDI